MKDKCLCDIIQQLTIDAIGVNNLGYREFAKDYQIEYVDRPGRKRPKAVRVYIGPWYRFTAPPEKIRFLRWYYLVAVLVAALVLLIPMCIDCAFTRLWYIQVPAVSAWIPLVFASCATWRLWTAKEQVDREHNALMGDRMSGASLFLMGLGLISFLGCLYGSSVYDLTGADYVVSYCCVFLTICGVAMFARRKGMEMERIEK